MLKIRVTQLEKFRRFIDEVSDYETEASLMETLTGKFEGNEYTRIGTAFHLIIERGNDCCDESKNNVLIDGNLIKFNQSHVDIALSYKESIKGCFHEIRADKTYSINGTEINVSGGADVVLGNQIRDIKTKYSPIRSISDYTDSCQWKFYCDIFELPEFYFDVFELKGYDKEKHGYDVSGLTLIKHDPIHCIQYAEMQKDLNVLLVQFLEYVKFRKLEYLFK